MGFYLARVLSVSLAAEAETSLCEESEVVRRLLLDCTEITEASFLQMCKITES